MADLFLHIGAPKTGTTAIQQLLTNQRDKLAAQGTLYPISGTLKTAHHLIGAAIVAARRRRLEGANPEVVLDQAIAGIRAEIDRAKPARIILSTEYLWGEVPGERARRLLERFAGHRLHVVAYLRRQDLLAQSLYTQSVKGGAIRTFHDWAAAESDGARAGLHFDRVLAGWRDCGPPVELCVRVYERGQIDADVARDFMATVCPEVTLEDEGGRGVNTSPDHVAVELLRRISQRVKDKPLAARLRRQVMAVTPPREAFAPIDYLGGQAAAEFLARFAAGNAWIARELLGREDGVLFREPIDPERPSRHVSGSAMLDRLVMLLPEFMAAAPSTVEPEPEDALLLAASGLSREQRGRARDERREKREKRERRRAARAAEE